MLSLRLYLLLIILTSVSVVEAQDRSGKDLLEQIGEARGALRDERVDLIKDQIGVRRVRMGKRRYREVPVIGIVGREMAIAVLDGEGYIRIARAVKREGGLDVGTPGFVFRMRRENGINSDIACIAPVGGRVVAVKYPVSNEKNRFGIEGDIIQAVYTPFSPEIRTPEIVKRGLEVQNDFIDRAYRRLKSRGVFSQAFPGRELVDVIPKSVLTVLLLNEHIDPGEFSSAGMTKALVERVLTVIGTNREKAYAYSISSAGARGLVQMIASTYRSLVKKYPQAGLLSDFAAGMSDPVNAVMAQVLLCDSDWQAMKGYAEIPASKIGPYLAAAYNGGVGRVADILRHDKTAWMESPEDNPRPMMTVSRKVPIRVRSRRGRSRTVYITRRYSQPIFRNETSKYVRQYHWIEDYVEGKAGN